MAAKEENEIESQSGESQDLNEVLSGDETSFVTEQKKPVDRTSILVFGVGSTVSSVLVATVSIITSTYTLLRRFPCFGTTVPSELVSG